MTDRHHNGLKTTLLFAVMWVILLAVGGLVASGTGSSSFIWIFALIGLATTFYGYWNSDKLAIRAMAARPVSEAEAPWLYAMVRELSTTARQPMPRIYIAPTAQPNAFATGRNPRNAAVCVTEGIVRILEPRELRGVLGHELMHVYNRDILTSSVAAAFAGLITAVAQFLVFFGGPGPQRQPAGAAGDGAARADRRLAHPAGHLPHPRVRRRRGRRPAHRRPAGPGLGAAQARAGHRGEPAAADPAVGERQPHDDRQPVPRRRGGEAVLHPPADDRADRAAGAHGGLLRHRARAPGPRPPPAARQPPPGWPVHSAPPELQRTSRNQVEVLAVTAACCEMDGVAFGRCVSLSGSMGHGEVVPAGRS